MNIINFNYNSKEVRTQLINNEPYFCLKDVCDILEIVNNRDVLNRLDRDGVVFSDGVSLTTNQYGKTTEQEVKLNFINEPNLYRVIFRSNKEEAKRFQDWVFNDVLPTLRKTGEYKITKEEIQEPKKEEKKEFKNKIDLNNFKDLQKYYMNDLNLRKMFFSFKINEFNKLPTFDLQDILDCLVIEKSKFITNGSDDISFLYFDEIIERINNYKKYNYLYSFNRIEALLGHLNSFNDLYKENYENSLLMDINNPTIIEENNLEIPNIVDYELIGDEKLYSATELGEILGTSNCMIGKIANKLGLKVKEYGLWFKEKSTYSLKEVQTFKYNKKVINIIKDYLISKHLLTV